MSIDKTLKSLNIERLQKAVEEDSIEDMLYATMRKMEQNISPEENYFLPMKLMDEYHNSEEYHRLVEAVRKDWEYMGKKAQQYLGQRAGLAEACKEKLARQSYGKGGPEHRGPLYPGHMEVIIRSGHKRGRLFQQSKSPDYIYGFDEKGELLFCKSKMGATTEYMIKEENRELGIAYIPNGRVKAVSEVTYDPDGKLATYKYGIFEYKKYKTTISSSSECYEYHDKDVYVAWIQAHGKYPYCEYFRFQQDENGIIVKGECCDVMRKEILEMELPRGLKL